MSVLTQRETTAVKLSNASFFIAAATLFIDAACILKLTHGPWESLGGLVLLAVLIIARIYSPAIILRSRLLGARGAANAVLATMLLAYTITAVLLASAIADTLHERAAEARADTQSARAAQDNLVSARQRLDELTANSGDVAFLAGAESRLRSIEASIQRAAAGGVERLESFLATPANNAAGKPAGVSVGAFVGTDCGNTNSRYSGLHAIYAPRCQAILAEIKTATAEFTAARIEAQQQAQQYHAILGARSALDSANQQAANYGSGDLPNDGYPAFTQVFGPLFGLAWINSEYTPARAAMVFAWVVAIAVAGVVWSLAHGEAVHNVPTPRGVGSDSDQSDNSPITIRAAIASRLGEVRERAALAIAGQSPAIASNRQPARENRQQSEQESPQIGFGYPESRNQVQERYNLARASGIGSHQACRQLGIPAGSASRLERNFRGNNGEA